jgi:hypothetical protein
MGFTMADPLGIVCHKPMCANVLTHHQLRLVYLVFTLPTGTRHFMLSFVKCLCQEIIDLGNEFIGPVTLTPPARVHPLTVIHPLTATLPRMRNVEHHDNLVGGAWVFKNKIIVRFCF